MNAVSDHGLASPDAEKLINRLQEFLESFAQLQASKPQTCDGWSL